MTVRRIGLCGLAASAMLLTGATDEAELGTIDVHVSNVRNAKGVVRACLASKASDFPGCDTTPARWKLKTPADDSVVLRFTGLKPGRYAFAILHDENNNNKADTALSMIPKEGFAFSRDAKASFGPPKFDAAAVNVRPGRQMIQVKMRYVF